jgi:hypothetical protein
MRHELKVSEANSGNIKVQIIAVCSINEVKSLCDVRDVATNN